MEQIKKVFSILLRVGISFILLYFLFKHINIDTRELLLILHKAEFSFIALGFLLYLLCTVLATIRWKLLLDGANIKLPWKRVIVASAGGTFFNVFMPTSIGGDMVRTIDLAGHTKKPKEILATVFLDRLSGYVGLVIVVIVGMVFGFGCIHDKTTLVSLAVIIALLLGILMVLFNKGMYRFINRILESTHGQSADKKPGFIVRIKETIRSVHHEMHVFRHRKAVIWQNLAISFAIQLLCPLMSYIIALALGVRVNPMYFFIFIPIIAAITLLPIGLGGLGLRDTATVIYFAKAGVSKDLALAMSLINFAFIVACACAGGIIYVIGVHRRRMQPNASSTPARRP